MFLNLQALSNTYFLDVNNWNSKQGPPLNEARYGHDCATASYNGDVHVFVVGGRRNSDDYLDSMEVFNVMEERWIEDFRSTKLPVPLDSLQVVEGNSPDFLVYVVGGDSNDVPIPTIYGLSKNKQWEKIGDLKTKRYSHATINIGQYEIHCQSK